jgi:mitochondrial import inner membrane translocase subunit TIM22
MREQMNAMMESCFGKSVISGVMGFGMGGLFGMFMASVRVFFSLPPTVNYLSIPSLFPFARSSRSTTITTYPSPSLPVSHHLSPSPLANSSLPPPSMQMAYDTPFHGTGGGPGSPAQPIQSLPWRRQLAVGFRDMGSRSWSTAKNFGMVGLLFSGIECGIEGYRAKNDIGNGVAAGCLTGGILARSGGPYAVGVGCAGFAAFSAAIDAYMRSPKEE